MWLNAIFFSILSRKKTSSTCLCRELAEIPNTSTNSVFFNWYIKFAHVKQNVTDIMNDLSDGKVRNNPLVLIHNLTIKNRVKSAILKPRHQHSHPIHSKSLSVAEAWSALLITGVESGNKTKRVVDMGVQNTRFWFEWMKFMWISP